MCHTFLELIQPVPVNRQPHINEKELFEIEHLAQKHNLSMLLYVQLKKYDQKMSENKDIWNYLKERKSLFLSNAVHCMRHEAIEKEIVRELNRAQIQAIVLKGNEIAKEIYQNPNCRTSGDIDILIKMSDVVRTDKFLTKTGYRRVDKNPLRFWITRLHHAQYLHPKHSDLIEIHWNFGIPSFFKLTSEEIWEDIVDHPNGEFKLSPDMMVTLLLIHHHMHAFRELKILVDIFWTLFRYESTIDWKVFAKKLEKIGLIRTTRITINQILSLWGDFAKGVQGLQILDQEIKKVGYAPPAFLYSYFKMDVESDGSFKESKDNIVFRFALDRWSAIIFSFCKSIFPFPQSIKELYEDRRNRALPKNYLRFIKWRLEEWRG